MSLDSYANLKAAVAAWANRTDLTAQIPDFITLAEGRIWDRLRSRALTKEMSLTYTAAAVSVALPADCVTVLSIRDTASGRTGVVEVVGAERYTALQAQPVTQTSERTQVMLTGREVVFVAAPTAGGSFVGRYLAREPALSDTNATNQVLQWFPGLYLYGALLEVADYLGDDARTEKYALRFEDAMKSANSQADHSVRAYVQPVLTVV